jgi:hypothetical protein
VPPTCVLELLLQAADDAGVAVWDVLAEGADLPGAGALHGVLEVDVLGHAHLVVKHGGGALLLKAVAVLLHTAGGVAHHRVRNVKYDSASQPDEQAVSAAWIVQIRWSTRHLKSILHTAAGWHTWHSEK